MPVNNTTALIPEYLPLRLTNLSLSIVGIILCSCTVSVIQPKYRATRDAFEFGLVLLQWLHIVYCVMVSAFAIMDCAMRYTNLEDQPALSVMFFFWYSLTNFSLILKNLWTLSVSCFRSAATLKPLAFRTFLTVKFQIATFSCLLLVALAALIFTIVCQYGVPEQQRDQLFMNHVYPLTRVTQSYIPIVGVVLSADILAVYLCAYRNQTEHMATAAGRRSFQRQSVRATCIVLSLSLSFTAFEAPGAVVSLVKSLSARQRDISYLVNDILLSLDSVFTFIVFFTLSSNFRAGLTSSFRSCRPHRSDGAVRESQRRWRHRDTMSGEGTSGRPGYQQQQDMELTVLT